MSAPALPWLAPLGATPTGESRSTFRVWAPRAALVEVQSSGGRQRLEPEGLGVHAGVLEVGAGEDYRFVLDGEQALPDPCTRWQPEGLRGPSRVLDPAAFAWAGEERPRLPGPGDLVLYELHVGCFTPEGTFDAAMARLPELAAIGVNAVEIMPVADFPGERGWGYDGVYLSAAHRSYGGPFGLQRFVDAAHREGIAVVLDVVYNHLGASGVSAMEAFGPYFTEKYSTFWGKAINYDDADSDPVREWVLQSAAGWIRDFRIDGLRLDAVHAIYDSSPRHIVAEVCERVHALGGVVIAESGLNDPRVIRPAGEGGWGCDAQWADDFHHALRVLLTGDRDGYYEDFGTMADLAKAYSRPFVHDGQYSPFRRRSFGAPATDRPPEQFVVFDQNHDQVGNRAFGDRLDADVAPLAAFCTLLSPFTPMLFMGEEYGEPAPFQFFSDHIDEEIATATREGRRREFAAFASFAEEVPDPQDPATFERSKLTREVDPVRAELYRGLLRERPALSGEAQASFDEQARWLRVRRAGGELICNFAESEQTLPAEGSLVLATHAEVRASDGTVRLPGRSGALLREDPESPR